MVGPYYFRIDVGNTAIVFRERYGKMMKDFLLQQIDELGLKNI